LEGTEQVSRRKTGEKTWEKALLDSRVKWKIDAILTKSLLTPSSFFW
jgi:hypothetical protein